MLRMLLRAALKGVAVLFGATIGSSVGLLGWLLRSTWEGATGRSLAAEAAEREATQAREDEAAQAQVQAEVDRDAAAARHDETALMAQQQLAETRALRQATLEVARRREQIGRQSRSHDPEVRSSEWVRDDEPEPESGAPALALA